MKLIHLADLHIGRRFGEMSLYDDQKYILEQILSTIRDEKPDAVLLAGDIYDKSMPSAETVRLCDDFLTAIAEQTILLAVSGNHDSPERLSYGSRMMKDNIHIAQVWEGKTESVTLNDSFGEVVFWLLPFIKPIQVKHYCMSVDENEPADDNKLSYSDAVRMAIQHCEVDTAKRNVMITHQFVTGAERSESEEISVGGTDNVDADVFAAFDYTALGHIHHAQNVGDITAKIRYSGTPMAYDFSEAKQEKSLTIVTLGEKGDVGYETRLLSPLHAMCELRGKYAELTLHSFYEGKTWQDDYVHITLTDEIDIPDAIGKLRTIYHNLLKLDYDNRRTRLTAGVGDMPVDRRLSPLELFAEFYQKQNGQPMNDAQKAYMQTLIEEVK